MPRRNDIQRIMILGSGPIKIGQAAEFDFSGSQACRALRADGFEVILVNSNPATIQNDPEMADQIYIEPLLPDVVRRILEIEKPDALLAGMGGQTALNLASTLSHDGSLAKLGVELIGCNLVSIDEAEELGFEGIMIRKDCEYKGKRSNDILKVKKMHDEEYEIKGYDFAEHRIIENGKEIKQRLLSQIYIEHKGNTVGVGSGFSKAQRKYYTTNFEELEGKIVTVQYFEETLNEEGNYSLRFPVVKHIYSGSRDC